jgi:hypothetical protein
VVSIRLLPFSNENVAILSVAADTSTGDARFGLGKVLAARRFATHWVGFATAVVFLATELAQPLLGDEEVAVGQGIRVMSSTK